MNKATRHIRELAWEEGPACIDFYIAVRDDPTWSQESRLFATKELLAYGYGRPSQAIAVEMHMQMQPSPYDAMSPEELAERAEQLAQFIRSEGAARQLPAGTLDAELVEPEPVGSAPLAAEPKGDAVGR